MEELGQTLDLNEFVEAAKLLYNTLSVHDKNKLLGTNHKWEQEKSQYKIDPSFEPQINKKSIKLAMKNRPAGEKLEDVLLRKKEETDMKLNHIRQIKRREELKGCTFHPKVHDSPIVFRPVLQNLTQYDSNVISYIHPVSVHGDIQSYIPHGNTHMQNESY